MASQTDTCAGPSITIASSADADQISSCTTYKGDVTIDSSASGIIQLNGVQQITGDVTCQDASQLTALTADSLNTIQGTFSLSDLTILSTLQFDSLTGVNAIHWSGLPALQSLNFAQAIQRANSVYISNTQLSNLDGIDLTAVGTIDINNNPYLTVVSLKDLTNVTSTLSMSANSRGLEVDLSALENAANITLRNITGVSLPSLLSLAGSLGLYSNTFKSFSVPKMVNTGGTLAIVDCPSVTSLSFAALSTIGGGLLIDNNTALDSISGFPKLKAIAGAIDLLGSFDRVSLPSLNNVRGGSNVETTSSNTTICDLFNTAAEDGVIQGTNTCLTNSNSSPGTPSGTTPSSTSSSTHSPTASSGSSGGGAGSSISGGAIGGIVAAAVVALIAAIVLWWYCIKRRNKKKADQPETADHETPELPLGGHHEKTELPGSVKHTDQPKSELPGSERYGAGETTEAQVREVNNSDPGSSATATEQEPAPQAEAEPGMKSRIEGRAELSWEYYTPELEGSNVPELESRAKEVDEAKSDRLRTA